MSMVSLTIAPLIRDNKDWDSWGYGMVPFGLFVVITIVLVRVPRGALACFAAATVRQFTAVTVRQCTAITVRQCTAVTVRQCTAITVRQCTAVTVRQCTAITVRQCTAVTLHQCTAERTRAARVPRETVGRKAGALDERIEA
eukprot:1195429-Prorocentrum_minimum.AAC.1